MDENPYQSPQAANEIRPRKWRHVNRPFVAAILFALTPVAAAIAGGTVCGRLAGIGTQGYFRDFFPNGSATAGMISGLIAVVLTVCISEVARLLFVAPRTRSSYTFAAIGLVVTIPIAFLVRYVTMQILLAIDAAFYSERVYHFFLYWGTYIVGVAAFGALATGILIGLSLRGKRVSP